MGQQSALRLQTFPAVLLQGFRQMFTHPNVWRWINQTNRKNVRGLTHLYTPICLLRGPHLGWPSLKSFRRSAHTCEGGFGRMGRVEEWEVAVGESNPSIYNIYPPTKGEGKTLFDVWDDHEYHFCSLVARKLSKLFQGWAAICASALPGGSQVQVQLVFVFLLMTWG